MQAAQAWRCGEPQCIISKIKVEKRRKKTKRISSYLCKPNRTEPKEESYINTIHRKKCPKKAKWTNWILWSDCMILRLIFRQKACHYKSYMRCIEYQSGKQSFQLFKSSELFFPPNRLNLLNGASECFFFFLKHIFLFLKNKRYQKRRGSEQREKKQRHMSRNLKGFISKCRQW